MPAITSSDIAVTILSVEERLGRNNFVLISNLRPKSSLLVSRGAAAEALKSLGIQSEDDFECLAICKQERAVVLRVKESCGGSAATSKIKLFLEELFSTATSDSDSQMSEVSWISEDIKQRILDKNHLRLDGRTF